ncbi:MAG: PorT family protein [Bacteroidales bacterium]|nr:PorT family protein [Bacteroidales bacterium]
MIDKPENIDRYFRSSLENFEADPDVSVWENISGVLPRQKKRRSILLFTRIAAGIALLSALGISIYYAGFKTGETKTDVAVQTGPVRSSDDEAGITSEAQPGVITVTEPVGTADTEPRSTSSSSQVTTVKTAIPETQTGPEKPVPTDRFREAEIPVTSVSEPEDNRSGISAEAAGFIQATPATEIQERSSMPVQLPMIAGVDVDPIPVSDQAGHLAFVNAERAADFVYANPSANKFDQHSEGDASGKSLWNLSGEFAPVYSYRQIFSDYLDQKQLDRMNEAESGLLSYAGGINVSYSVTERISVQSGIHYSRYGQEKEHVSVYRSDDELYSPTPDLSQAGFIGILNSTGTISLTSGSAEADAMNFLAVDAASSNSSENNLTAIQYFNFLELPVILRYKLIDRKLDFRIMGGMVTNLMVGNRVYLKQEGSMDRIGKTGDVRQINYAGILGIGFEYPLFSLFTWTLEPRFRYYLNPIDKTPQINVHPYSFGIFTGLSYTF